MHGLRTCIVPVGLRPLLDAFGKRGAQSDFAYSLACELGLLSRHRLLLIGDNSPVRWGPVLRRRTGSIRRQTSGHVAILELLLL